MNSIEIFVATHKKQNLILPNYCKYIQVNTENQGKWAGYIHDNDGNDNISKKNESYCELTALYALWKNSNANIKGLFHYRRCFLSIKNEGHTRIKKDEICRNIISEDRILELLSKSDVILEIKSAPFPLTVFEDLQKFVYINDIWVMIHTIENKYPEYTESLWNVLNSNAISYCNMFISESTFVDEYCTWLFDILGKIERRVYIDDYDTNHKRIYGYLSEILLNVYINHHNKKVSYVYRIDLMEKNTVKQVVRCLPATIGIYPLGADRKIYKARYLNNKNSRIQQDVINESTLSSILVQIRKSLKMSGCSKISTKSIENGYVVEAYSINAKIIVIISEKAEIVKKILKKIRIENSALPFGTVEAYRIFCQERIDKELYRYLIEKGMTIISRND